MYSEIVAENEKYRTSIVADEYPCEPDVLGPLVRITPGYYGDIRSVEVLTADMGQEDNDGRKDYDLAWQLSNALERFGERQTLSGALELAEVYFRVFHGLTVHVWDGDRGDYWYAAVGDAGKAFLDEYRSWCEGDVWLVQSEEKRTGEKVYDNGDAIPFEEWGEIETISGYIGREYAEAEARDLFDQLNKEG